MAYWVVFNSGYLTPCWIWTKSVTRRGYGQVKCKGKVLSSHRWVYEKVKGKIPDGLQLHHLCNIVDCVNPDHMAVVSSEEHRKITKREGRYSRA